jgi:hypothetical protein
MPPAYIFNLNKMECVSMNLYKNRKFDWRHLDIIHLLMNHRSYSELFAMHSLNSTVLC